MLKALRLVACAGLAVAAAACASEPPVNPADYYTMKPDAALLVQSGVAGALAIDFRKSGCEAFEVVVLNVRSGLTYRKVVGDSSSKPTGDVAAGFAPMLVPVPPGLYVMEGGRCAYTKVDYATVSYVYYKRVADAFPLVRWLSPVEVKAGEIVYPGSVREDKAAYEYGIALDALENLNGRKQRSTYAYMLYDVADEGARVRADIARYNPTLADRFVARVTPARLDKQAVQRIVSEAFAAEAGQVPPDNATANRNRDAALKRAEAGVSAYVMDKLTKEFPDAIPPALLAAAKPADQ